MLNGEINKALVGLVGSVAIIGEYLNIFGIGTAVPYVIPITTVLTTFFTWLVPNAR